MSEEEFVEVCLKLPRGLVEFLKVFGDVEEYLVQTIMASFRSDIESLKNVPFIDYEKFLEKFNLKSLLER